MLPLLLPFIVPVRAAWVHVLHTKLRDVGMVIEADTLLGHNKH
jgi:hypothetical protein